ncbi:probable pre-mRNA-splicing factor ATP-dependent RNA helicase DEAH5 [Tanacetum coccineum]|uniref:RNA helicase n=1 Tax=Tanacetum coccineum TaxID=301880 RepID=A0ABQ4YFT7_9ASTR
MSPTSILEIMRINLCVTTLTFKAMGIGNLFAPQALISAMQQLYSLEALDEEGHITKLGLKMTEFPLEPPLSKMLIASIDLGCDVSKESSRYPKVTSVFNGQAVSEGAGYWFTGFLGCFDIQRLYWDTREVGLASGHAC